jgi:hypothetical protein
LREPQPLIGELVDARRWCSAQLAASIRPQIAVADIVRQYEHNVGLLLGMSRDYEGGQRQRKQGKGGNPIAQSHGNISWYRGVAYLNLTRISGISSELQPAIVFDRKVCFKPSICCSWIVRESSQEPEQIGTLASPSRQFGSMNPIGRNLPD